MCGHSIVGQYIYFRRNDNKSKVPVKLFGFIRQMKSVEILLNYWGFMCSIENSNFALIFFVGMVLCFGMRDERWWTHWRLDVSFLMTLPPLTNAFSFFPWNLLHHNQSQRCLKRKRFFFKLTVEFITGFNILEGSKNEVMLLRTMFSLWGDTLICVIVVLIEVVFCPKLDSYWMVHR